MLGNLIEVNNKIQQYRLQKVQISIILLTNQIRQLISQINGQWIFQWYLKPSNQATQIEDTKFAYQEFGTETKGKISFDYNLIYPCLGKGAFGEVYRGVHKVTNQVRSIKLITKKLMTEEDSLRITRKVDILKQLDHLNIISIYEFYYDSEYFYIVTELWKDGELCDRLISEKNFSEKQAAIVMEQILSAVTYCHEKNIVNRDLKPENVLYESNNADSLIKKS